MPTSYECRCGRRLQIPDGAAAKRLRCKCGEAVTLEAPAPEEAGPAPEPPPAKPSAKPGASRPRRPAAPPQPSRSAAWGADVERGRQARSLRPVLRIGAVALLVLVTVGVRAYRSAGESAGREQERSAHQARLQTDQAASRREGESAKQEAERRRREEERAAALVKRKANAYFELEGVFRSWQRAVIAADGAALHRMASPRRPGDALTPEGLARSAAASAEAARAAAFESVQDLADTEAGVVARLKVRVGKEYASLEAVKLDIEWRIRPDPDRGLLGEPR